MNSKETDHQKRTRIISQSFQLFRRYGIRNITMDDISQKMGISNKTIYKYFHNKEDLLISCVEKGGDKFEMYIELSVAIRTPLSKSRRYSRLY